MAAEVKPKRPVPPQFLKKKKEKEELAKKQEIEQLPPPPTEIIIEEPIVTIHETKKEIDINGLTRDLVLNRFYRIMEKEARPIAERMAKEGAAALHDVKWFLALSERQQLANELKEKFGLF